MHMHQSFNLLCDTALSNLVCKAKINQMYPIIVLYWSVPAILC